MTATTMRCDNGTCTAEYSRPAATLTERWTGARIDGWHPDKFGRRLCPTCAADKIPPRTRLDNVAALLDELQPGAMAQARQKITRTAVSPRSLPSGYTLRDVVAVTQVIPIVKAAEQHHQEPRVVTITTSGRTR
jgi:hypothetical protein